MNHKFFILITLAVATIAMAEKASTALPVKVTAQGELKLAPAKPATAEPDETLDAAKLPLVSARITGKELQIIYNIPEGQHATVSKSFNFMTVTTTGIKGLEFGETICPEGEKDPNGNTVYHGIFILKKPIKTLSGYAFEPRTVAVTAGYQLCLDSGVCMPPKKETINLSFTLEKQ
ncbi:protein-disulfide reductase DsbD domain-containing protein [Pontiella sulfatireligans]|uniref:Thiol:disulfide interchange protein DsbD N-terminal domain-containing protein n=1 Tax=Pontiella sulfatireligans TaxID=2750658 RepID=A0A6C2UEM1_9BACT|nr:protein-disulfide reductase DsbD domain-containing protein [Pontiella sulfatireligans]VGO18662.1 hypothetical protein SCARR_00715 [Pontiella sulfatireligans]